MTNEQMREAVALAVEASLDAEGVIDPDWVHVKRISQSVADAAIAAIWPMFRERAVGVADDFGRRAEETLGSVTEGSLAKAAVMGNVAASRHIATAIRNLKDE